MDEEDVGVGVGQVQERRVSARGQRQMGRDGTRAVEERKKEKKRGNESQRQGRCQEEIELNAVAEAKGLSMTGDRDRGTDGRGCSGSGSMKPRRWREQHEATRDRVQVERKGGRLSGKLREAFDRQQCVQQQVLQAPRGCQRDTVCM